MIRVLDIDTVLMIRMLDIDTVLMIRVLDIDTVLMIRVLDIDTVLMIRVLDIDTVLLQVVYYKYAKFHKNPISALGGVALTRCMYERTDGRTDRVNPIYPQNFVCEGYTEGSNLDLWAQISLKGIGASFFKERTVSNTLIMRSVDIKHNSS
jgi:hypothetical protein